MMREHLGVDIAATIPIEVGGGNSFAPLIAAGRLGIPTVDADGMGRAFPEGSMITFYFNGHAASPTVMTDCLDRKIVIEHAKDSRDLERIARAVCVQMGGSAMVAEAPFTVKQLREVAIPNTMTFAHRIGDAVLTAQAANADPIAAVCEAAQGRVLFVGKITDVDRRFERGYNFGRLTLAGSDTCG